MAVVEFTPEFMATGRIVPSGKSKIQYGVLGTSRLYLECRATPESADTWYVRLDGPKGLIHKRLGTVNDLSVSQACKLANQIKAEHRVSQPVRGAAAPEDAQEQTTLERFFHDIYMPQAKIHKRSFNKDESLFRVRIGPKFGHKLLSEISRREVQAFHHAPCCADSTATFGSSLLRHDPEKRLTRHTSHAPRQPERCVSVARANHTLCGSFDHGFKSFCMHGLAFYAQHGITQDGDFEGQVV